MFKIKNLFKSAPDVESETESETVVNTVNDVIATNNDIVDAESNLDTEELITESDTYEKFNVELVTDVNDIPGALDYLDTTPEIVGYASIQDQFAVYEMISKYIESNSIIDFGCGRGDYYMYRLRETGEPVDYVGVDMNPNLIASGNRVYKDTGIVLKNISWFNPEFDIVRDWAISICSLTTRYDSSTISDEEYLLKTIESMMDHCVVGSVLLLTTKFMPVDETDPLPYIHYDPGALLNKLLEKYGYVNLDHSFHDSLFILYILK